MYFTRHFKNLSWVAASSVLGACTQLSTIENTQITLVYLNDDAAYVETATSETIAAFTNGGGASVIRQIPTDFLDPEPGYHIEVTTKRTRQAGIRISTKQPIETQTYLFGSASLVAGQSHFLLPDGAGILVEPINMRFRHLSVDANAGLRHNLWSSHKARLSVEAAVGTRLSKINTTISSPVVLARHESMVFAPYVSVGTRIGFGPKTIEASERFSIGAQWRFYPRTSTQTVTAGLGIAF